MRFSFKKRLLEGSRFSIQNDWKWNKELHLIPAVSIDCMEDIRIVLKIINLRIDITVLYRVY